MTVRKPTALRAGTSRCPICDAAVQARYRPFCSRRCADLDLGRWLTGAYATPALETDDPDAEDQALGSADRPDRVPGG